MERTLLWIRANPQFAALGIATVIIVIVLGSLSVMMSRSGLSLRPIVWFLGFLAIVGGPQAAVHALDNVVSRQRAAEARGPASKSPDPSPTKLQPIDWSTVFGPKGDPDLVTDPRKPLEAILGNAVEAKLGFNRDAESALAARFRSAADATAALDTYQRFFSLTQAQGSRADGYTARRHAGQGEWVHVVAVDRDLYAWTGPTRESVVANRERALGALRTPSPTASPDRAVSRVLASNTRLMIAIVGLNLLAASLWFFKGSAWAARVEAAPQPFASDSHSLRHALLELDRKDLPVSVKALPGDELEVTWKYADARWFDLMRAHQMKRIHRLVLSFDEGNRAVRVREYWSAFDASVGRGGARLSWQLTTGIQFFAHEHKRVLGVQLDEKAVPTGAWQASYTFNLQEMKAPLIDAVTNAGWRWQPLVWSAPASLRWFTE